MRRIVLRTPDLRLFVTAVLLATTLVALSVVDATAQYM